MRKRHADNVIPTPSPTYTASSDERLKGVQQSRNVAVRQHCVGCPEQPGIIAFHVIRDQAQRTIGRSPCDELMSGGNAEVETLTVPAGRRQHRLCLHGFSARAGGLNKADPRLPEVQPWSVPRLAVLLPVVCECQPVCVSRRSRCFTKNCQLPSTQHGYVVSVTTPPEVDVSLGYERSASLWVKAT